MMASPLAREHALIWGSPRASRSKEERAWQLCRQYIDRARLGGLLRACSSSSTEKDDVNRRIARALDEAQIPVVLRPWTVVPLSQDAGTTTSSASTTVAPAIVVTEHLLRLGSRRIAFIGMPQRGRDGRCPRRRLP